MFRFYYYEYYYLLLIFFFIFAHRSSFPSQLFYTWETLLQEVETDSKSVGEVANVLGRQISRPLLDRSFYRKLQSRKVFGQRDSLEVILQKAEDKLAKVNKIYVVEYFVRLNYFILCVHLFIRYYLPNISTIFHRVLLIF